MQCPKCGKRIAKKVRCKFCGRERAKAWKRTAKGCLMNRFGGLKARSISRNWPAPDFSQEWFVQWGFNDPQFRKIFGDWERSNYKKWDSPSIDRINPEIPYTKENLQWITWAENWEKGNAEQQRTSPEKWTDEPLPY